MTWHGVEVVTHSRDEWRAARHRGIGASEAAAVMGASRWTTREQLIEAKVGPLPAEQSSPAMARGHAWEQPLMQSWAGQVGQSVVHAGDRLFRHPEMEWHLASPDGWCADSPEHLIEIKTTSADWRRLPDHVWWQVQQQMSVTGGELVTVVAWTQGRVFAWDVEKDRTAIAELIATEERVWQEVCARRSALALAWAG